MPSFASSGNQTFKSPPRPAKSAPTTPRGSVDDLHYRNNHSIPALLDSEPMTKTKKCEQFDSTFISLSELDGVAHQDCASSSTT